MKLIDDWRRAWRLRSVQVAGIGGAVAFGLAASAAVVPWVGLLPVWVVFLGGGLVCCLTIWARIARQEHASEKWLRKGRGPLSSRKVPW